MGKWLQLAIGGVLGTVARYLMIGAVDHVVGAAFPYGTLLVNVSGCFLIGAFAALEHYHVPFVPHPELLFMAGFCGAFTTFSTFMLDTNLLLSRGEMLKAALNVAASLIAGFLAFRLGAALLDLLSRG